MQKRQSFIDIPVIYCSELADDKTLKKAKVQNPVGILSNPRGDRKLHSKMDQKE
jgi:hypothetical protein